MELNSSLSFPPPTSPPPPPPSTQLYSLHALDSCSACFLGYFCRLHLTLGLPHICTDPQLCASLWKTGAQWFIVFMQYLIITKKNGSTSGEVIHTIELIQVAFKLHQDLFLWKKPSFFLFCFFSPLSSLASCLGLALFNISITCLYKPFKLST